jgi:hypothetical protein
MTRCQANQSLVVVFSRAKLLGESNGFTSFAAARRFLSESAVVLGRLGNCR